MAAGLYAKLRRGRTDGWPGEVALKVAIDAGKCAAHGRCHYLYPEIFVAGPDGKGLVAEGRADVAPDDEIDVEAAANACPTGAILISYD